MILSDYFGDISKLNLKEVDDPYESGLYVKRTSIEKVQKYTNPEYFTGKPYTPYKDSFNTPEKSPNDFMNVDSFKSQTSELFIDYSNFLQKQKIKEFPNFEKVKENIDSFIKNNDKDSILRALQDFSDEGNNLSKVDLETIYSKKMAEYNKEGTTKKRKEEIKKELKEYLEDSEGLVKDINNLIQTIQDSLDNFNKTPILNTLLSNQTIGKNTHIELSREAAGNIVDSLVEARRFLTKGEKIAKEKISKAFKDKDLTKLSINDYEKDSFGRGIASLLKFSSTGIHSMYGKLAEAKVAIDGFAKEIIVELAGASSEEKENGRKTVSKTDLYFIQEVEGKIYKISASLKIHPGTKLENTNKNITTNYQSTSVKEALQDLGKQPSEDLGMRILLSLVSNDTTTKFNFKNKKMSFDSFRRWLIYCYSLKSILGNNKKDSVDLIIDSHTGVYWSFELLDKYSEDSTPISGTISKASGWNSLSASPERILSSSLRIKKETKR